MTTPLGPSLQRLGMVALALVLAGCKGDAGATGPTGPQGSAGVEPSGAVVFFNLSTCPAGWSELTAARGRYVVGLPASGTIAGVAGTALTDLENRPTGLHNHAVIDPGHGHLYPMNWGYAATPSDLTKPRRPLFDFKPADAIGRPDVPDEDAAFTGIIIGNAGSVGGTNAPYIQLLACQKS